MKKQLQHMMTTNDGFYLPYALTVTAFVLMFLATLLYIYHNELAISRLTLQQIEAETFIQMSRQEFMGEMNTDLPSIGETQYVYPNGKVVIEYERESSEWIIDCTITMDDYKDNIDTQFTIPID